MNANDKEFLINRIRSQYVEKQTTELDDLRDLDRRVRRPADVLAYVLGSFGALVMGAGMSLVMTDLATTLAIANPMVWGIVLGVIGLGLVAVNYPLYRRVLGARRRKYAQDILALSDKIAENN